MGEGYFARIVVQLKVGAFVYSRVEQAVFNEELERLGQVRILDIHPQLKQLAGKNMPSRKHIVRVDRRAGFVGTHGIQLGTPVQRRLQSLIQGVDFQGSLV